MNLEGVTYRRGLKGGNFGFSYIPKKIDGTILSMQISMTMMLSATIMIVAQRTGILWLLFGLVVPIGLFFYIFIKSNKDRHNRRLEIDAALNGFTDEEVQLRCRSVYGDGITCKHRAYIIRQKGTAGEFERMFAAYLSNGVTVVFPVIQRTNEKGKWSLTIKGESQETSDNGIIDKSLPPGEWLSRMVNPDKNAVVDILLYLLIWAVLLGVYVYPIIHFRKQFLCFWGGYMVLMLILSIVRRYVFKIPPKIEKVLLYPSTLAGLILNLSAPILAILTALIIPCLMGIFIAAIIYGLSYILTNGTLGWNLDYALFLSVALTSILTVYGNKGLMRIYERSGLFQCGDSKSLENQFLGLMGYIFQKGNTNALVYSAYFLFIVFSSINFYIQAENANASIIERGVDKIKSVTATDIFNNFMGALGSKKVWCVPLVSRTNGIDMHLWRDLGCISIYLGEQNRNINYSGMALFVKGTCKSANYTGDCRLTQAKSVFDQEAAQGINTNEHVLVAPHHGGDYGASFRHYSRPCNDIAISVGTNNSYGHPQKDMLRYLRSLGNVKRTDVDGDIEVRL